MRRLLLPLSVLVVASFAAGAGRKAAPSELALTGPEGTKVRLSGYRGKVVVLNFWATWCVPCREEMPMLVEAEKIWGPKGVVFIGASLDDSKTKKSIPDFVREFHVTYPVWTGATADDLAKLHMGNAVPDTVFLDKDGVIFARVRGEIRRAEIDERLEWITGDTSRPAPEPLVTHLDQ